jgi:hypothetical protein
MDGYREVAGGCGLADSVTCRNTGAAVGQTLAATILTLVVLVWPLVVIAAVSNGAGVFGAITLAVVAAVFAGLALLIWWLHLHGFVYRVDLDPDGLMTLRFAFPQQRVTVASVREISRVTGQNTDGAYIVVFEGGRVRLSYTKPAVRLVNELRSQKPTLRVSQREQRRWAGTI